MDNWGYDYDIYEVKSGTNFQIPLYNVTGLKNTKMKPDKDIPVLIMHDANMSAATWLKMTNWPLKLFDAGYDVWLGNSSDVDESVYTGRNESTDWMNNNWAVQGVDDLEALVK